MSAPPTLDTRTRELIAIGASIGGNCLPCLRYHFAEALKAGCALDEIEEAIALSKTVKERPIKDLLRLADELVQREQESITISQSKPEGPHANL